MPTYVVLPNSTILDLTSYRGNGALPTEGTPLTSFSFNLALVLERANDPSGLLTADWASRQKQLAALGSDELWTLYGADPAKYNDVLARLAELGISTVDQIDAVNGYVSSPESRTIWVQVNETNFTTLFGQGATLLRGDGPEGTLTFWKGDLSLPDSLAAAGVKGVVFDTGLFGQVLANPGGGTAASLAQGAQSAGNAVPQEGGIAPNDLAALYGFPFNSGATPALWTGVKTGAIGLLEPSQGTALPAGSSSFQDLLDTYRKSLGIDKPGVYISVSPGGSAPPDSKPTDVDERSLDVGIATAVSPNSALVLYAGSGRDAGAASDVYTVYQAAFWDLVNNPEVVSSSYRSYPHIAPHSPFSFAYEELYIDAVLRNITMVNAVGDGGSGDQFGNGLTNVDPSHANSYTLVAGGTSLSTLEVAAQDSTLSAIAVAATAGDPATIWQLVSGGMTSLPATTSSSATAASNTVTKFIETVWNGYFLFGNAIVDKNNNGGGYIANAAAAGGVDPSQQPPSYQTAFGLDLLTTDPDALPGRGVPDVAALAGGNLKYEVPLSNMTGVGLGAGTSAAAPLWSALVAQFNAIFRDQQLPQLGYMNDLLYIAAAIAPGAFNDVTVGNNTSSFSLGGMYTTPTGDPNGSSEAVTPTGFGYTADESYDLVSGLGTPNGLLLARALTAIAHEQMSFASDLPMLEHDGASGWKSTEDQSLLIQVTTEDASTVGVSAGTESASVASMPADEFAWTSQFAQQTLQADFDPALVRMFDGQTQGALTSLAAGAGVAFSVTIDAAQTVTPQATLTKSFGFIDFAADGGADTVRIARPVAVAETVGARDDQEAVVRVRQNGEDSVILKLYRVDDLAGTIDGLAPGDAGYAAAAEARAYATASGATSIQGPGFGNYTQTRLVNVDAGDLIAMQLSNGANIFWGFAAANETVGGAPVDHLWNYGLNTWGWEDLYGGGDRDFNDLVVQLDFSSAFSNGWLA